MAVIDEKRVPRGNRNVAVGECAGRDMLQWSDVSDADPERRCGLAIENRKEIRAGPETASGKRAGWSRMGDVGLDDRFGEGTLAASRAGSPTLPSRECLDPAVP